jgi:phenylpropionate dioxygenase-like ring-hydroxylating dioxygenase large terminal subunit
MSRSPRYDIPAYTSGWFQVGWSDDLRVKQIKKVHQFGRVYTMFRGADGQVGIIDDVCPHLGAHFSEGGAVEGNTVRCPYHGWRYDRTGACVKIPYADKIPAKARVAAHTAVERYGMIFMYRSTKTEAPSYPLPTIEDFDPRQYHKPTKVAFKIKIHGQDIMENSVDSPHFWAVHGHDMPSNDFRSEGTELRITQASAVRHFGIELKFRLQFHMREPGFHYIHFPELPGAAGLLFSSLVPIDNEYTDHRMTIWIKKTAIPFVSHIVRRFLLWQMLKTYREDLKIWETKEYHSHPVLCEGDGSIMKLRGWYKQFYDT